MRFVLDSGSVGNRETLHRVLAAGLQFPDWYGGNLDALHDCLTEINQPTELVIRGSDTLGAESRGAKRIVFSNDGLIYYTGDHYESFELLYGEE